MNLYTDCFFDESTQVLRACSPRKERFLTDAEIEELLRDDVGQIVAFAPDISRKQCKIA